MTFIIKNFLDGLPNIEIPATARGTSRPIRGVVQD